MGELLTYGLLVFGLIVLGFLVYQLYPSVERMIESRKKLPYQGVVKRDWLPTGRIDFATQIKSDAKGSDQPSEFKLLVEERRIVESVAGNENLEIQWRLATLKEAKVVITQYHKYLLENSLIRSVSDDFASSPTPTTAQSGAALSPMTIEESEGPRANGTVEPKNLRMS
jgi:hypothetical protein